MQYNTILRVFIEHGYTKLSRDADNMELKQRHMCEGVRRFGVLLLVVLMC